ncbi:TOBE domain-containing protein [Chitinimonas sp. BJYL2]|uniref:TOBE domain-containing protein n=1 Tax=Chitinimonas sp. BJYL2 TaxID=2976696 RepID=UPI0022B2D2D0|nr:TOBE domain-containing protein [Chitinimonas sp. BJYL2]
MSAQIELQGAVWLTVDGEKFGSSARIDLLAAIADCGSITHAAKAVKLSYKAAWDAIDSMNNLAGEPLVERMTGGKGGGSTRLTARGTQLVGNFRAIDSAHRAFLQQLSQQAGHLADDYALIRRMSMRTSARNQYLGKVSRIRQGAVNDEVELIITGGHTLVAVITRESTASLGLHEGSDAYALVKSSSVMLACGESDVRYSARNQLAGTVSRIVPGSINHEVTLSLPGGSSIAAIITRESCDALGLAEGQPAVALFKAASVILAVPA